MLIHGVAAERATATADLPAGGIGGGLGGNGSGGTGGFGGPGAGGDGLSCISTLPLLNRFHWSHLL
jgi:hypothetical protein